MTAAIQHDECRESLGAYALGALPEEEAERVREHLAGCHECRAELEGLRSAVDALPASVAQVDPPAGLKARLMATVESEAALLHAAGPAADRATLARPRRAPRRWWAALGVAAAGLAAVVVLLATASNTRTIPVRITSAALVGHVRASLRVTGSQAELQIAGLPAPPANHVEELWVQRGSQNPLPAGTFLLHSGSVRLSRPVKGGDRVLVTTEPGRGSPQPTGAPLLVARV